jgi:hypothetical protein
MMTTFDGSSAAPRQRPAEFGYDNDAPRPTETLTGATPYDALAALREQLDERTDENLCYVEIPKLDWRLVCDADFPYAQYAKWQKASFPAAQRNRRKGPNPLDMDQAVLSRLVLLGTCQGMEYRDSTGEWQPLMDSRNTPMTPDSAEIMSRFQEVDPGFFLRRLFGSDSAVMRAGEQVMRAAGWLESDGEDVEDPID